MYNNNSKFPIIHLKRFSFRSFHASPLCTNHPPLPLVLFAQIRTYMPQCPAYPSLSNLNAAYTPDLVKILGLRSSYGFDEGFHQRFLHYYLYYHYLRISSWCHPPFLAEAVVAVRGFRFEGVWVFVRKEGGSFWVPVVLSLF